MINFLAQFRRELFGIVQLPVSELLWKNRRRRHNRTGQGAAPGLIDPGDVSDAETAQSTFMPEPATTIHFVI